MIFIFHFLTWVAACLGIGCAYLMRKKMPTHLVYFFFFMGVGLMVHLFFDYTINPRECVIQSLLHLEQCAGDNVYEAGERSMLMFRELFRLRQPI